MTTPQANPSAERQEHQVDVIDHPAVALWMKETARKDPEGFMRLAGPNVRPFTRMWGKPDWKNAGEKGWTHGWGIYENNMHWLVLTGPKGTLFRLRMTTPGDSYLSDPRVGVGVTQYLSSLLKILAN